MTRVRAGERMVLSRDQWAKLSGLMHGEDDGGAWIMQQGYTAPDVPRGCVAISTGDEATLIIFLTHLLQVTSDPEQDSVYVVLEDLRYLADKIEINAGRHIKTYYLPIVSVEREGSA